MKIRENRTSTSKLAAFLKRSRSRSSTPHYTVSLDFYEDRYCSRYIRPRNLHKAPLSTSTSLIPVSPAKPFDLSCARVLDAPNIIRDFYSHILSWEDNLAVALCSQLYIWPPLSGDITQIIENPCKPITSVAWKKDSLSLTFSNSHKSLMIYDYVSDKFDQLEAGGRAYSQEFLGNLIFSALGTGSFECVDLRAPRIKLEKKKAHLAGVTGISVAGLEKIATVGRDGNLKLWDLRSEFSYFSMKVEGKLKAVKWHPTIPDTLAVGGSDIVVISQNGIEKRPAGGSISGLEWSENGRELVGTVNKNIKIWSMECEERLSFEEHCEDIYFLCKSKEQDIVTGSLDETLRFWNLFKSKI